MTGTQIVQLVGGFEGTVTLNTGVVAAATPQTVNGSCSIGSKQASGAACTSRTGITYTGATAAFSGQGSFGCAAGTAGTETVTMQVQWFIGSASADTSTIDVTVATDGLGVKTLTVAVHGGQLDGATATAQFTAINLSGNCGTTPLTGVSFAGSVDFLR